MNKHEKRLNILTVAVFLVLLYTLAVIFLLKPAQSFSEEENRNLQEFPAWNAEEFFNGAYSTKINDYFADQFPFRNAFVGAKSLLETALLKQENNNVLLGSNGQLAVRGSTLTYFDEDGDKKSATLDFYFPEKLEEEAGYIRALRDSLEEAGRQFALVMPPRTVDVASSAFRYPADHSEALLADVSRLFADCNYVDLAGDMKARYDAGEYVYYKTDHHWTTCGAFYGANALLNALGKELLKETDFTPEVASTDFNGTLYSTSGIHWLAPDTIEYWVPEDSLRVTSWKSGKEEPGRLYDRSYLEHKDKYSSFLGGNQPLCVLKNPAITDGSKLLLIRDSYSDSLAPFLAQRFSEVHLLDLRYYHASVADYMAEQGIDTAVVLYSVSNFITDRNLIYLAPRG